MLIALGVFLTDIFISFNSWQTLDNWLTGRKLRVLLFTVITDIAIGINVMGFVTMRWWMLVPSVIGSAIGTWFSFYWRFDGTTTEEELVDNSLPEPPPNIVFREGQIIKR